MFKLKKIVIIFSLCLLMILSLTGCGFDRSYKEDNPELFTVAIYSLLGAHGYTPEYHGYVPTDIEVLEKDDYGRVLFAYCEDQSGAVTSLLVIQKSDEMYSYYYPDYNFISKDASHLVGDGDGISGRSYMPLEKALPIFTNEDKLFLKELNDWNKPIDESKCNRSEITCKKEVPQFWKKRKNKEKTFESLCQRISTASGCKGEDTVFRFEIFGVSDNYGRALYYVYGLHRDVKGEGISPKSEAMYFDMAVILNPDGTYGDDNIMRLRNMHDYQYDLKTFKELNNWNMPL